MNQQPTHSMDSRDYTKETWYLLDPYWVLKMQKLVKAAAIEKESRPWPYGIKGTK